ncbi:hypothetical protein [Glutamicibacter soli]
MAIEDKVLRIREILAPALSENSLELLDIVIEDEEWADAYSMEMQAAKYHELDIPAELLDAA